MTIFILFGLSSPVSHPFSFSFSVYGCIIKYCVSVDDHVFGSIAAKHLSMQICRRRRQTTTHAHHHR